MPLDPEASIPGTRLKLCNPKDSTLSQRQFYQLLRHIVTTYGLENAPHAFRFVRQRAMDEVPHVETESPSTRQGKSKKKTSRVPLEKTKGKRSRRVRADDNDGDHDDNDAEEQDGDVSEEEDFDLNVPDDVGSDSGGSVQAGPSSVPSRKNPRRKGRPATFDEPEASDVDSGRSLSPDHQSGTPPLHTAVTKVAKGGQGSRSRSKTLVGDARPSSTPRPVVAPGVGEPSVSTAPVAGGSRVSRGRQGAVSGGGDRSVSRGGDLRVSGLQTPSSSGSEDGKPCGWSNRSRRRY